VQSNGKLLGLFPERQIHEFLLLGRVSLTDKISRDQKSWRQISTISNFASKESECDPDDEVCLLKQERARIRANERKGKDRRVAEVLDDQQQDQRGQDRRENEDDKVSLSRVRHSGSNARAKQGTGGKQLAILFLLLITLGSALYIWGPDNKQVDPQCDQPFVSGINWDNCDVLKVKAGRMNLKNITATNAHLSQASFYNAKLASSNLSYSDLSYADFRFARLTNVRMVGVNLQRASLSRAHLKNVDLSYADLRGVDITELTFEGVSLSKAIWVDGKVCAVGSVNSCQ